MPDFRASKTHQLVTLAILVALDVIFTRFLSVNTPILRIGFGFLPVVVCAILYGPWKAGAAHAIGDVIGAVLFPSGAFFPGFTLSAFLGGVIYGLFFYQKRRTPLRVLAACAVIMLVLNLGLGSLWISMLYGKSYLALVSVRIVKELIAIPIYMVTILFLDKTVIAALRSSHAFQ